MPDHSGGHSGSTPGHGPPAGFVYDRTAPPGTRIRRPPYGLKRTPGWQRQSQEWMRQRNHYQALDGLYPNGKTPVDIVIPAGGPGELHFEFA